MNNDRELFSEVFDKVPSAIVILDARGMIHKANRQAHSLLGVESLEGRPWLEVIKEVFRPRKDDGHEISTHNGKRLQVATEPLASGQLVQMTDLTETRVLQDKLSHMERLSSLGKMAASLAHQIRTPLSAAMLYAANLSNPKLNASAHQKFQEKLMSRLEDLNSQVGDILMFARSGVQTAELLDAKAVIEEVHSSVISVINKAQIDLEVVYKTEPMPLMGNMSALNGAISNLVVNAIEAKAKHIKLMAYIEDKHIVFAVGNDGEEVNPEIKDKMFEPFFTSKSHGTGLGLAVVNAVAKVHQGSVSLESNEEATVFKLKVPLFKADSSETHSVTFTKLS